ncbi:hypothetical protein GALL_533690 [mine drainage metagenome]|uniref:Uncharacterized protein n=1 Tax=mine drainage metagenome TaxID=410659 RepID=A0A1J5P1Y3_9ZZZZ
MAEALEIECRQRATGRCRADRFALCHQLRRRRQQPGALHLPGQLIQHAAGIHCVAWHLRHAGLDRHRGQGPGPGLERVGPGAGAGGHRITKGRLEPEAEGLGVERHHHIAIGGHRIFDWCQRIAAIAQQLRVQERLLGAKRGAGKRHLGETANWRGSIGRLERQRHLRPRPLGSCHRSLLLFVGQASGSATV